MHFHGGKTTLFLTVDGVTRSAKEWARLTGTKYHTIRERKLHGCPDHECVYGRPWQILGARPEGEVNDALSD